MRRNPDRVEYGAPLPSPGRVIIISLDDGADTRDFVLDPLEIEREEQKMRWSRSGATQSIGPIGASFEGLPALLAAVPRIRGLRIVDVTNDYVMIQTNAPVRYDWSERMTVETAGNWRTVAVPPDMVRWHVDRYQSGGYRVEAPDEPVRSQVIATPQIRSHVAVAPSTRQPPKRTSRPRRSPVTGPMIAVTIRTAAWRGHPEAKMVDFVAELPQHMQSDAESLDAIHDALCATWDAYADMQYGSNRREWIGNLVWRRRDGHEGLVVEQTFFINPPAEAAKVAATLRAEVADRVRVVKAVR